MLNREICRKCIAKHEEQEKTNSLECFEEALVKHGVIYCPMEFFAKELNDSPLDVCPYILEHIVACEETC